jgi:DNA-binding MarR family transcriptional regulator
MTIPKSPERYRAFRNSRLYRSLTRTLRVYHRILIEELQQQGFTDFKPSFPSILSNLDTEGTHIGVLASRAGVTRQAAGQLVREVERCGYVTLARSPHDTRATLVRFTARGRKVNLAAVEIVQRVEREWASMLDAGEFAKIRAGLLRIADRVDPGGSLGRVDRSDLES